MIKGIIPPLVTPIDENGNVGVGDSTPASLFTVGNGDLFQVNSSGQATFTPGTTGTFLDF